MLFLYKQLLHEVLAIDSPAVIRSWIERYMTEQGLQDLVRSQVQRA